MIELKDRMKAILLYHQGKPNAIKRDELRVKLNLNGSFDREMRKCKRQLIAEGVPVLSGPSGYYLPASVNELKAGIEYARSYLIDEALCIRDLKVKGMRWLPPEQGRLELG